MFGTGKAIVAAVLLLSGCTAGMVVDENFNPVTPDPSWVFTFVAVDDSGAPTGDKYSYHFYNGAKSAAVSFDPYAADTDSPTGQFVDNVPNSANMIPEGAYYVSLVGPLLTIYSSAVFTHSYSSSCSDFFNGNSERCAEYYFQLFDDSYCATCTPLGSHNGIPVVPMYASSVFGQYDRPHAQ